MVEYEELKIRLQKSKFRSGFHLSKADKLYIAERGWCVIEAQTKKIITQRLGQAYPVNDGKQTPMRGHVVFIAQHATGCCCRSCLWKWQKILPGHSLNNDEIMSIVKVILEWMRDKVGDISEYPHTPDLFQLE